MLNLDHTDNAAISKKDDKGKKQDTITAQFMKQMDSLYHLIADDTKPHFIRCVKPNTVCKPKVFENQMSMRQMRYSSLFGICQVRQMGFPERYGFTEFVDKFGFLFADAKDHVALVKQLNSIGAMKTGQFAIGTDKVFVRQEIPHFLEFEWAGLSTHAIQVLQNDMRMGIRQLHYRRFLGYIRALEKAVAERDLKNAEEAEASIKRAVKDQRFLGFSRHAAARSWLAAEPQMRQEQTKLDALNKAVLEQDLDAINAALAEIQKFDTSTVLMAKKEVKEAVALRDALVLVNAARAKLGEVTAAAVDLKALLEALEELEKLCANAGCSQNAFECWEEVIQAKLLREDLEEQARVKIMLQEAVSDGSLPALAAALAAAESLQRRDLQEDIGAWKELAECQEAQRKLLQDAVKATLASALQKIELGSTNANDEQQALIDLMTQAEALGLSGSEVDACQDILGKKWEKEKEAIEIEKQAESKRVEKEQEKERAAEQKKRVEAPPAEPKRRNSQTVMANSGIMKKGNVKGKRRSNFESLCDYELRIARLEAFYLQTLQVENKDSVGMTRKSPWEVKMSLLQKSGQRQAANPYTKTNYSSVPRPRATSSQQRAKASTLISPSKRGESSRRGSLKGSADLDAATSQMQTEEPLIQVGQHLAPPYPLPPPQCSPVPALHTYHPIYAHLTSLFCFVLHTNTHQPHIFPPQGYLHKRPKGALSRTWQQRFFTLIGTAYNPRLCYSASEGGSVKGIYPLTNLAGCEISMAAAHKQKAQVRGAGFRLSRSPGCCDACAPCLVPRASGGSYFHADTIYISRALQEISINITFDDGEDMLLKVGTSDSLGTMEDAEAWQAALQQLAHSLKSSEEGEE
jgi:myosin heavy subunit